MAVSRCVCTHSALEIFIQDVAGVATQSPTRRNLSSTRHHSARHNISHIRWLSLQGTPRSPLLSEVKSSSGVKNAFDHSIAVQELRNTDDVGRTRRPTASIRSTSGLLGRNTSSSTAILEKRRPISGQLSTARCSRDCFRSYSTAKQKQNDEEGDIVAQVLADAEAGKRWNEQPDVTVNTKARQTKLSSRPREQERKGGRSDSENHDRVARRDLYKDKRISHVKASNAGRTAFRKTDTKTSPAKEKTEEKEKPEWMRWKEAMKKKLNGQSWNPRKRVSPDSMNGIRALHAADPETYNLVVLGEHLKMSTEAVRRILRSKWQPTEKEAEARRIRWGKRGEKNRAEIAALDEKKLLAAAIRREKAAEATKQVRDRFDIMRRISQEDHSTAVSQDHSTAVSREGW